MNPRKSRNTGRHQPNGRAEHDRASAIGADALTAHPAPAAQGEASWYDALLFVLRSGERVALGAELTRTRLEMKQKRFSPLVVELATAWQVIRAIAESLAPGLRELLSLVVRNWPGA